MPPENHYVVVVHGTWNPPGTPPAWHQRNDEDAGNFCTRLNGLLTRTYGMDGPVWRPPAGSSFEWSGGNRHEDRLAGAARLLARINEIAAADPLARVHLVGHSHGCNVILKAVEQYLAAQREEARRFVDAVERELAKGASIPEALQAALARVYGAQADAVRAARSDVLAQLEQLTLDRGVPAVTRHRLAMFSSDLLKWKRAARDLWVQNAPAGRIGRLVFLGPVFIHKQWQRRPWWSPAFLAGRAFNLAVAIAGGLGAIYVMVLYMWGFLALLTRLTALIAGPSLQWPVWNPLAWHWGLQLAAGVYVLGVAIAFFVPNAGLGMRDVNLYFDEEAAGPIPAPLPALVVSAGVLDEALLAFSAEPLVYAILLPQVRALTRPKGWLQIPPRPTGLEEMPNRFFLRLLGGGVRWLRNAALTLLRPVVPAFERMVAGFLLRIISAPAYGVPPLEFEDARISASADPALPRHLDVTRHDVQAALLDAPFVRSTPVERARYAFMADDGEFARRRERSWLVAQLEDGRPMTDGDAAEYARACLVLEERLKEFAGAVQLTHSAYYGNEAVITEVAAFIAGKAQPRPGN